MAPSRIRNDADYRAALERLEGLIAKQPAVGSEDGEELEVLSVLVAEYERAAFPIDLPSPIEAINFRMEQMNLEPRDLVPMIGSRARVSEILNGKRSLTLTMIRALHHGLGIPAAVLLGESNQDNEVATDQDWSRYPIREMAELGWLAAPKRILAGQAEQLMKAFVAPLELKQTTGQVLLRRTRTIRSGKKMNPYAIAAWCTRVQIRALAEGPLKKRFDAARVDSQALVRLARLSLDPDGPRLVKEHLGEFGIRFIVERHLSGTHLDGAALLADDGHPIIALTLRYDRIDSFWFNLLHELVHVSRHLSKTRPDILDDMQAPSGHSSIEREADEAASEALVPSHVFRVSRANSVRSVAAVLDLAGRLGVHPAVVAGRIRNDSRDYRILGQLVGQGEIKRHFPEIFEGA